MSRVGEITFFRTAYAPNGKHWRVYKTAEVGDGWQNSKFLCDFKTKAEALIFKKKMEAK